MAQQLKYCVKASVHVKVNEIRLVITVTHPKLAKFFQIIPDRMDSILNKQQRMAERQKNMQNKIKMTLENEDNQKVICFLVLP